MHAWACMHGCKHEDDVHKPYIEANMTLFQLSYLAWFWTVHIHLSKPSQMVQCVTLAVKTGHQKSNSLIHAETRRLRKQAKINLTDDDGNVILSKDHMYYLALKCSELNRK